MSDDLSLLFVRATELAIARGDVPEDGSGVDGLWTDEFPDYDRDSEWFVVVNTEDETQEYDVTEQHTVSIDRYRAHFWWGRDQIAPAAIVNPFGGEAHGALPDWDRTVEDQAIISIEAVLDDLGYQDFEAVMLDG